MTNNSITLRDATEEDIDRIERLLEANGLPYQDVRAKIDCFFVATSNTGYIGIAGVETYGTNGLLRSVVVTEPNRGQGYGTALCDELEEQARTAKVDTLYLLTTTAAAFFRQRGYETTSRENAPPTLQETAEFADFCPTTAICMRKRLDD